MDLSSIMGGGDSGPASSATSGAANNFGSVAPVLGESQSWIMVAVLGVVVIAALFIIGGSKNG